MTKTTTPINIVFLDGYTLNPGDTEWTLFEQFGNFTAYDRTRPEDIVQRAREADILIVNKTRLTAEHFDQLSRLRLVCVAASGYDVVDIRAARAHGVTVCNAAGYGTESVAQLTMALLLEATSHVGEYAAANRAGMWTRSKDFCCWNEPLTELCGKTMGIIGFGHIGSAVARLAHAFGMKIIAYTSKSQDSLPEYVMPTSIDNLFRESHVVSLNCPLTAENQAFVNAELLAGCRQGMLLLNTARGRLIDDIAVADALRTGRLGAYCCDVLSEEPPRADHPLLTAPHCYITPHIGWATLEARQRLIETIADNIRNFMNGHPTNVVNP